ncbi:MAG: anti-sigma factor antagonist [Planctomycetota bacterium]|nr:MAG: anti-sigma factor antagonist [Planctomycetota bacterium]
MSMSEEPRIAKRGPVTVVSLGPQYENLDEAALERVQKTLLQVAADATPPLVVIDLSHTTFFGSSFIEILFRMWNRLNQRNGRFAISGLTDYCREVLEVARLNELWRLFDSAEQAAAELERSSEPLEGS